MVTTKDADLAEKIRKLRVHGAKVKYFHELIGGNFRLHELQAAFLRVKLRHLNEALQKRRRNAQTLIQKLQERWKAVFPVDQCFCEGEANASAGHSSETVLLPYTCQNQPGEHTWNQFVIRIAGKGKRDAWRDKLTRGGIQSEVYYPRSMHEQQCFSGKKSGAFPVAEALSREALALPLRLPFKSLSSRGFLQG